MITGDEKRGRGRPKGNRGKKRTLQNPTPEMVAALKSKLVTDDITGCWVFQAKPTPTGHATFYFSGEIQGSAHRIAYEMWVGPIPVGGYVLQSCGNKLCCNPDHLYIGTFGDVMKLRGDAGNTIKGSRNPKAKLLPSQVADIRTRSRAGEKPKLLSEEFGVSLSTISQIKRGNIWRENDGDST
jgi:hypothetical protein